jgi:predicted transcriptional regulator
MAMTLRLTEEQDHTLEALAAAQNISKQEAAVRAIEEQAQRIAVAGDVRRWADMALERYRDLLDRLAK